MRLLKEILVVPRKDFEGSSFADFRGIPLPLDPDAIVDGILPARLVKSIRINFRHKIINFYSLFSQLGPSMITSCYRKKMEHTCRETYYIQVSPCFSRADLAANPEWVSKRAFRQFCWSCHVPISPHRIISQFLPSRHKCFPLPHRLVVFEHLMDPFNELSSGAVAFEGQVLST